jgi:hypothetical protein
MRLRKGEVLMRLNREEFVRRRRGRKYKESALKKKGRNAEKKRDDAVKKRDGGLKKKESEEKVKNVLEPKNRKNGRKEKDGIDYFLRLEMSIKSMPLPRFHQRAIIVFIMWKLFMWKLLMT